MDETDWSYSLDLGPEPEPVTWGDEARTVGIGLAGVASGLAGAAEATTGAGGDTRRFFARQAKSMFDNLTPQAQQELTARILPTEGQDDIWDADISAPTAIRRQVTASIPSLLASLGVTIATRSPAAGIATASALTGGSVFEDITKQVEDASDDELRNARRVLPHFARARC